MNFVGIALLNGIIPTQTGTNFVMKIGARSMWPGKIDYETNKIRWAYRLHKYIFRFRYHSMQYKTNKDAMPFSYLHLTEPKKNVHRVSLDG